MAPFSSLERDDWLDAFQLNVMSVVDYVQASLYWLKESSAARIINIASISGVEPGVLNPNYSCSKAAVINLSKYLANQLAKDNILVNVICPGQVATDARMRHAEFIAGQEGVSIDEARRKIDQVGADRIPLGKIGESEDIASLVLFLASEKAKWITGSSYQINGGKHKSAY